MAHMERASGERTSEGEPGSRTIRPEDQLHWRQETPGLTRQQHEVCEPTSAAMVFGLRDSVVERRRSTPRWTSQKPSLK